MRVRAFVRGWMNHAGGWARGSRARSLADDYPRLRAGLSASTSKLGCVARSRKQRKGGKPRKRTQPRQRADTRTRQTRALGENGVQYASPERLIHMQPLRTESGDLVYFPSPFAWVLLIDVARTFRDRGERARRRTWKSLTPFADGQVAQDEVAANDALAYLSAAVVLAFAAIEAYANEELERLPATETIKVGRQEIARDDMARQLSIEDKLKKAVPRLADRNAIAGDAKLWARFVALKTLRDDLVHLKERGYSPDPEAPSPYARLMRGDAANAPDDAAAIIQAILGSWPEGSRHLLGEPDSS